MKRLDCLKRIAPLADDIPCFVSVGSVWREWCEVHPSDANLLIKTLGLGSSLGLGLALVLQHRKVLILDGDGAVLMNLNGVITVGWIQPRNLIHVVFDNHGYEASGSTPSATAYNAKLAEIAKGAGIESSCEVTSPGEFEAAFRNALSTDGPHFINAVVELSREPGEHARFDEVENRYRFIRFLEKLEGRALLEYPIDVQQSLQ